MDEEDFVETSDPEELELSFVALKRFHSPDDCTSPLKRTKLYHAPVSVLEPSALDCFARKNDSESQLIAPDSQEDVNIPRAQRRDPDLDVALPSPTHRDYYDRTGLSFADDCLDSNSEDVTPSFGLGLGNSPGSSGAHATGVDTPERQEPKRIASEDAYTAGPFLSSRSPDLAPRPYSSPSPLVPYSDSASDSDLQGAPVSREHTPNTETSEFQNSLALPSTSSSPLPTSQASENIAQALFPEGSILDLRLTPLSSPGRLSSVLSPVRSSPEPRHLPTPSPPPLENNDDPEANIEHEALFANDRRYSLRTRQAKQIRPYAYDKLSYKQQLRGNPDAIVKAISPRHHRRHSRSRSVGGGSDHNTQDDEWQLADSGSQWMDVHKGSVSPRASSHTSRYPGILPEMPDDDEDTRELDKEAKQLLKMRKAREKREKEEAKLRDRTKERRLRRFPVNMSVSDDEAVSALPGPSQLRVHNRPPSHARFPDTAPSLDLPNPPHRARRSPSSVGSPARSPTRSDYGADYLDDAAFDFPMEVDDGIIRNSRDSPIIVGDDGPGQSADPGSPTQSDSGSHDEVQPRGKFRLLRRMMPEVLARKYETMGKPSTSKVSRRSRSFGDNDHDDDGDGGPILPGQSRRHITHGAREVIEIKGDTESSDDAQGLDDDSEQSSLSEAKEYRSTRAPTYHTTHDEHEVLSISSADEDEAEVVGDEVIRACLDGSNRASFRKSDGKSESLIDWMLNRQRPAGRKPKRRRRKRARLEFATAGAKGKSLRQSTLFENFGPDEASSSSQPSASGFRPRDHALTGKRKVRSSNSHGSSHTSVPTGRSRDTMSHDLKKELKAKADRRKKRGLTYTFTEEGTRVTSGRRNSNIVTIDIEDEGFRQAIAHRWEPPKPGHPPQTRRIVKAHRRSTLQAPEYSDEDTQDRTHALTHKPAKSRRRRIEADFGLHPLPSGRSFNPQSHIGKGRLYKLTNILFDNAEPPPLPNYSSNGFDIGPDHSVEEFVDVFRRLCDSLLETVVGLPEDDAFATWQGVMHVACQAISWYRVRSNDDSLLLRNAVDTSVTKLADGINDAALSKKDLDSMTFAVCWFAIESLARAGPFPGHNATPSDTFRCASSLLVRHLLRYGLEETMKPVTDLDRELDEEHGLPCYTAELWVYLIHLAPLYPSGQPALNHFIWGLISDAIPEVTADMSNVDSSEAIWHAVFSICALSHFSSHGMAVSASRLPACWELVSLALKQVKLITDLTVEQALSQSSLRKRDEYIGIMILRCHILVHRWNWSLDRASAVLTQIAEVFRSRKYADLAHERSGFPSFMVNNDWSLLDNDQHEDTAFVIFLKFLVRGSKLNLEDGTRKLTPMVKKLISLTVPVGRLPSDRDSFLSERERTMLRNRYCAAAVALYLEPANASLRISQARAYVNVKTVDHDTQIIIIRATMYFGLLLMSLRLPLVDWWSWIEDITKDLLLEYEAAQARLSDDAHLARDRLVVSIAVLVAAMNKIVEFFLTGTQEYPDPLALARLVPLTRGSLITEQDVIADRFRKLLLSFLEARDAVMPAPQRPTLVAIESQESQDEYGGFDLDVEDPEFLAAMGEGEHAGQLREHQAKEKAASEIVHSHIGPAIYRHMCRFFSKLDGTRTVQKDYDGLCLWIDCWIGFANVVIQSRKVEGRGISWSSYLDRRADSWGRIKAIHLRRWVDMRVMLKLLKTDPMEYVANKARCIAILFECFAASKVQGEDEYITVLFSFEGSTHDLLRDVSLDTSETGDTTLSPLQFIESRDGIFASIVSSLNERLNRDAAGEVDLHADNQQYIGCLISMFQAMEAELQALTDDQERHTYRAWCSAVGNSVERCSQIRAEPRLAYWLNWCRNLAI
ncbi:hypothetical protein EYR38_009009 [Pleurotus pulmonarius]|nr:hypothetical protein EYR38_009009 [Pleurotus pulmonarius]